MANLNSPVHLKTVLRRFSHTADLKDGKIPIEGVRIDFVDVQPAIASYRRMVRDIHERKRTAASVYEQYLKTVRTMYRQFVEPSRAFAHIILPWETHNDAGLELLVHRIRAEL